MLRIFNDSGCRVVNVYFLCWGWEDVAFAVMSVGIFQVNFYCVACLVIRSLIVLTTETCKYIL